MSIEAGKFYTLDYNTPNEEVVEVLMVGENFASVVGVMTEQRLVVNICRLTN